MYREIINTVPFNLLILVLMISFMVLTYVVSRLSNYWFLDEDVENHLHIANHFMGILTGGFFILLAFIIINTWNYEQEAHRAVAKEADCLAVILNDIKSFPPEHQEQIKQAVGNYVVSVRGEEWHMMREGNESLNARNNLEKIYAATRGFQPQSNQETLFYTSLITNTNCVLESRRNRLDKVDSIIPQQLRDSIVVGSIFFALILGVIRGKDNFINLIPTLLFSGLLGFNLAIALNLDYPFSGNIAVNNSLFYQGALGEFKDN